MSLPQLFDLKATAHGRLFAWLDRPWEALAALEDYLGMLLAEDPFGSGSGDIRNAPGIRGDVRVGPRTRMEEGVRIEGIVHIGADCIVESGAYIRGPAWIGDGCEIRQGAYLRGVVLAGKGAVLGHASEFKHCVLLEGAQAPHFNYVGDSILGIKAHLGAGVIVSNLRLDKRNVRVALLGQDGKPERYEDSGLQKFGALIGDGCEVGCNSVLNPGTVLGVKTTVAPLTQVKGTWPAGSAIP